MSDSEPLGRPEDDGEAERVEDLPREALTVSSKRILPTEVAFQQLLEVERSRIESVDKRTEVMRLMVQASDESDKRQFEFRMTRLKLEDDQSKRRYSLSVRVFLIGSLVGVCLVTVLLGFALYGSPRQSAVAIDTLVLLFTAVGGFGVFSAFKNILNHIFGDSNGV